MPVLVLVESTGDDDTYGSCRFAVLYAVPVGFYLPGLDRKKFFAVIVETATTTGVIMVMLYAVMIQAVSLSWKCTGGYYDLSQLYFQQQVCTIAYD